MLDEGESAALQEENVDRFSIERSVQSEIGLETKRVVGRIDVATISGRRLRTRAGIRVTKATTWDAVVGAVGVKLAAAAIAAIV